MHIPKKRSNLGFGVATMAALTIVAVGFLAGGGAAVTSLAAASPSSCGVDPNSSGTVQGAAGASSTSAGTTTTAQAGGNGQAGGGTGPTIPGTSPDNQVRSLLAEIQRLSTQGTTAARTQMQGLLTQVLGILSSPGTVGNGVAGDVPGSVGDFGVTADANTSGNRPLATGEVTTSRSDTTVDSSPSVTQSGTGIGGTDLSLLDLNGLLALLQGATG